MGSLPKIAYDTQRLAEDMAERGWTMQEFARRAGTADMTVARFLRGERQTAKTCKALATAMGYSPRRYIIRRTQSGPLRQLESVAR
jgi:transcriptional regulator with XRE-family HTH domain